MRIGKYIINRSSKIRRKLINAKEVDETWKILLWIYQCRILGFCFYRSTGETRKIESEILKEKNDPQRVHS